MKKELTYDEWAHRFGRISLIIGSAATLIYSLVLILVYRIPAEWGNIMSGVGNVLLLMTAVSLSEFLSISPMIGTSAMYIMVLTGNYTNLKIPASIAAMQAVGLDPANYTEESDVISTISMAVSAITSIVIIAAGVALYAPLSGIMASETLAPAFDNIVPALFGALAVSMIGKYWKLAIVPFVLGVILLKTEIINSALVLAILILIGVLCARLMYRKNWV